MALTTPSLANKAYASAQQLAKPLQIDADATRQAKNATAASGFEGLMRETVQSVMDSGSKASEGMKNVAQGATNIVDVVTAVAEAELALNTMVAFRDKAIQAYKEILQMPI